MNIRFFLYIFSIFFITACGGSGGGSDKEVAESSNLSSTISSSSTASSLVTSSQIAFSSSSTSSSVAVNRQKINPSEANFFQESGLWVTFTKIDVRRRSPQNNVQKPFLEERLLETSVNTYLFTPSSNDIAVGECVRTLEADQVSNGFMAMLFDTPIGAELYCITDEHLYLESDGSYTVEYRCGENLVATTQMIKVSSLSEFQDLGLNINGAQTQQPVCANWNISDFAIWSLDADGNEIEREESAPIFNGISFRIRTDEESLVINFTNGQSKWFASIYEFNWSDWINVQPRENVLAEVTTANAGINSVLGKHFTALDGELHLDRIEPLRMSGSFEMSGSNDASLSGSFSFDVSEYFSD